MNLGSDIVRKIGVTFRELDELNRCLHEQPEGVVGGPLHVVTDDGNVEDHHILDCVRNLDGNTSDNAVVRLLAREMLRLLSLLTAPQRLVWYLSTALERIGEDPVAWAVTVADGEVKYPDGRSYEDEEVTVTKLGTVVFPGVKALRARREEKL